MEKIVNQLLVTEIDPRLKSGWVQNDIQSNQVGSCCVAAKRCTYKDLLKQYPHH